MVFTGLSEATVNLIMTCLAQSMLGIILFFVFRHFSRIYIRRFLRSWSHSWIAFAVYMLCSALILLRSPAFEQDFALLSFSFLAQLGCFSQIFMILIGTYQLVYERPVKRKVHNFIIAVCTVVSLITVLAFSRSPEAWLERYELRIGTRTFIPACGFLLAGLIVLRHHKFATGFGQKLLAAAFLLYSLEQFFYFFIVMTFTMGPGIVVPRYFGLIDLLIITVMGLGKVMWLLENEREKLNKANKELDSFLYSTSHDLRAPIASILGLTYLGKIELQEERGRTFMIMIEERIRKLDMVIADILSLARSKKFDVKVEDIDFNQLLDDTIVDVKFSKGASSISLIYENSMQNIFHSDYHQMKVILSNIISNAVKYHNINQSNPYIKVLFNRTNDRVEIAVEDNGQGIPEESLPRIFEMFYRASVNTEGTGLGLYIVQEALAKIKGNISVKSALDKGSTFTILLENV